MTKAKNDSDAWREVERAIRTLGTEDATLVTAIHNAEDQRTLKLRIATYYGDRDRADRTPRVLLYLHLGMLAAQIDDMPTSIIDWARKAVQQGAGHDCAEWRLPTGICAVCGALVASDTEH
jgi:hypothetical protein